MKFISDMTKKQKKVFVRIVTSAVLTALGILLHLNSIMKLIIYLTAYLIIGYDILKKAVKGIINRQLLDENFLMAVATIGAIILAVWGKSDYLEAVAVMLFYQTGELFQSYAVGKSRKNIASLMNIRPEYANVEKDGALIKISPENVMVGTVITVLPGERVPIDSVVVEGGSSLDTSALTGESIPRDVMIGDSVASGCVNLSGVIKLRTVKAFGESSVCRILDLVENAGSRKSKSENFISKFARIYTPVVCFSALLISVTVPLFRMAFGHSGDWAEWLYRGLTFLVVSCPCALVISIPLTFFSGLGGASREGILIKGSNYMETLAKTDTVVFDKTGTLTKGNFKVKKIVAYGADEEKLLEYALLAESASSHPISKSLREAYGKDADFNRAKDIKEITGKGVCATVDGKKVYVGNIRLMNEINVKYPTTDSVFTAVHIAVDGEYKGYIIIGDKVKESTRDAIKELKKSGIDKCVMLTGDNDAAAAAVAKETGIDEFYSNLLPEDKVEKIEMLISKQKKGHFLAFAGDGINDAPVLSRADIGIAMGAIGSQAAIEAADVVLMDDDLKKMPKAIRIARKCVGIVYQNAVFSIGIKLVCLVLTAYGITNMWFAIFADVGVMVLAVLNAMRALVKKRG